jgi:hypothetical protein
VRDVRVGHGGIVIDCVGGGLLDYTFDFARSVRAAADQTPFVSFLDVTERERAAEAPARLKLRPFVFGWNVFRNGLRVVQFVHRGYQVLPRESAGGQTADSPVVEIKLLRA